MLPIYTVEFNKDGNYIVSAGMENGIKIIDYKNSVLNLILIKITFNK